MSKEFESFSFTHETLPFHSDCVVGGAEVLLSL